MLVASSEDHLLQLVQIRDQWRRSAHVWVTFNEPDARSLLKPVFALIAVLVKLDSRGAVFFRQVRWAAAMARSGSASSAR
jgi:lipopolysaccharide/colanic/teichoic acid biosynthesis glycosyltransferase